MASLLATTPTGAARSADPVFSDECLMQMIQARNRDGLCLLHERYAQLLKKIASGMLRDQADVEDVIQEVFTEIWKRAASFDAAKGQPIAWLATFTRRRAIDRVRRRDAYTRTCDRFTESVEGNSDSWTHVHEDVARHETHHYLGRALAVLPVAQRDAIRFAYHGQMSQREIAAHTGVPLGTVKTRLELGLKKMALFLRGFEDLLEAGNEALPRPIPPPATWKRPAATAQIGS